MSSDLLLENIHIVPKDLDALLPINEVNVSVDEDRAKSESEMVELEGRKQFFALRKRWSRYLIRWISGILIFQIILSLFVGMDYLDFTKYQWFLEIMIGQTFLQIIGMGYVVIQFLYPKHNH